MTLKPTIINGEWVFAPPPPQDQDWLKRHSLSPLKPKEEPDERAGNIAKAG